MISLTDGTATLELDPVAGGRVRQLVVDGLEVLAHTGTKATRWGSFVMAPWAGRIRHGRFTFDGTAYQLPTDRNPPHAIHGTVLDRPWAVLDSSASFALLECSLGEQWPWPGRVRHRVTVGGGRARFELEILADAAPFPASAGWHPWFHRRLSRGADVRLDITTAAMLARDGDGIPTGSRAPVPPGPWDDCFDGVEWPVSLHWPGALSIDVAADTPYVVVFDQLSDAVCVEPQTGPPDALTLEPVVVTPDRPMTAAMTWTWHSAE
jgi:aldose 1-epimerase